jgi:hypothetical protein
VEYQEQTQCTDKERSRLYKVFKRVLESSTSQVSLEVKLKSLHEAAFDHPLLKVRLDELKKMLLIIPATKRERVSRKLLLLLITS